ncbi:alpha/beta hydrolase-fold protein [Amycolatopsis sp. NPDC004079]|uniref:alpha/beta hydrolase n=1 Tax=Amycolatopsis sp. NPDC004079 TaxID=3154549 RepID=UPI00339FD75F
MRSLSRAPARLAAAVVTALAVLAPPAAHADEQAPPVLADGFGLTQVGSATGTGTDFVLTVTTAQVAGPHHLKIILPAGYDSHPAKRYPVLYFLHGSPDDPAAQGYPALTASSSVITVIPDGGHRGWYANWRDRNTVLGAQNWENFHLDQVIPFIDANLRTIAAKKGRAVAGVSMGGFGALHYAEDRPDLFSQVASLSGDIDLSVDSMDLRMVAVATVTNAVGAICASASGADNCTQDSYAPGVDSDALFGSPYPVFDADRLWNAADPSTHVDKLAGVGVSIYVGNNDALEFWLEGAAKHVKDHLDALRMPYYYVDYGNGATWGTNCNGGHNGYCWEQDLVDYLPRLEKAFAA